jgi:excisionase family DNA binding protein
MEIYLSTEDLCKMFGVKERTIYRWIDKGMPFHRQDEGPGNPYRFIEKEVKDWFEGNK